MHQLLGGFVVVSPHGVEAVIDRHLQARPLYDDWG
jgi:hypothetical protein